MMKKRVFVAKGQGIVEYILITALVTLVAVAVFRTFREHGKEAYRKAGKALVQGVSESASTGPSEAD